MSASLLTVVGLFFAQNLRAEIAGGVLCSSSDPCNAKGIYTKASAGPTKSDAIRVNPAAVPVEKITGIETIYYDNDFDFALVKGLGRVGAAISPSNNEETFFGAPAVETDQQFEDRMRERGKYETNKYTIAAAVNLFSTRGRGLLRTSANLGVMARYYTATSHITPGAGLQFSTGPFLFGGAVYQDERRVPTDDPTVDPKSQPSVQSAVSTYSATLNLESFMIDYSVTETRTTLPAKASVATVTGFWGKRTILTLARRQLISERPAYRFSSESLDYDRDKVEWFGGGQYRVAPFLVLGLYYNYYLVREASVSAIIFF
ncbi:MAG: hypothetical protein EOP05_14935 [Proteobacteria bacterium]|nr:MAG: hypothetical protein EOP05_14935 [Pseudomonadota bacterium]